MSDQQKIWFIYLTDHHEGPFTPAEVAEKVAQGAVTAQSLAWKDGMPEWLAIEAIPELSAIASGGAAQPAEPAPAAPAGGGEENFSLAQLLAQQQGGGGAPAAAAPIQEDPSLTGATSVLSSLAGSVQAAHPVGTGSVSIEGGSGLIGAAQTASPVGPGEDVWTLRVGGQVSGMHSLNRLKALAGDGEVPPDAELWRVGWQDFQPVSAVPEVASARKAKKAAQPAKAGVAARAGIAPITAGANLGDDEPTDPGIGQAQQERTGFMARLSGLFAKRKAAPAKQAAKPAAKAAKKGPGPMAALGGLVKKLVLVLLVVGVLGGGGAAYFLFFSSPIPSSLDVLPEDLEAMRALVKEPADQGGKLYLALARGTEDDIADDTAPKFYVATNLPEGSGVTLTLTGQPGTLVNRMTYERTYNASVGKNSMAVFQRVDDEGKPLPMGEYDLKVSAEGAEPLLSSRFLGGKKGGIYADRLKRYKDRVQEDYDKEMQELREFVDTLKSLQEESSRKIADFRGGWANPGNRTRITTEWKAFKSGSSAMLEQLDTRLKGRSAEGFHPRAFQDVGAAIGQLRSLFRAHEQRVDGAAAAENPDELETQVQAAVGGLEQYLTQALVKSPFELQASGSDSP